MEPDILWLYLAIFMLIPAVRLISVWRKRRLGPKISGGATTAGLAMDAPAAQAEERPAQSERPSAGRDVVRDVEKNAGKKPVTRTMMVLGEINRGANTFEAIQKATELQSEDLDAILGDLERDGMLVVHEKRGMLGSKIELYPTDKGFRSYYS